MTKPGCHTQIRKPPAHNGAARVLRVAVACLFSLLGSGCAAITNPVANGIPVRRVPPELLAGPERETMQTIPLTLLKQRPPKIYRLAPGDVLGTYIEGVLPATAPTMWCRRSPI